MVDVVIVNWNCAQLTAGAVASVAGTNELGLIVIVDGGSEPADVSALKTEIGAMPGQLQISVLCLSGNRGFGAANNAGFAVTSAPYVLFLNPDTVVFPGTIEATARVLDERAEVGVVGCRLLNGDGSIQPSWYSLPTPRSFASEYLLRRWRPRPLPAGGGAVEVGGVSGAFMLVRRDAVPPGDLFDEGYFMYSEEVDLCARIRAKGWGILYLSSAAAVHFGGGASGGSRQRPGLFLEMQRSRLRYARRHFHGLGRLAAEAAVKFGTAVELAAGLAKAAVGQQPWSEVWDRAKVYPAVWRL